MVGRDAYIAVYPPDGPDARTLYIGVTSQLSRRMWEHREGVHRGFTKTYGLKRLVWCEPYEDMSNAIQGESPSSDGRVTGRST